MKRVLVAGGAGFLGFHLCQELLQKDYNVVCLDNLYSGSQKNIEILGTNANFEYIQHDVTIPIDLIVDEIYNLACPASPVHYQVDPIQTTKTSFLGTLNLLELATRRNATILQASTSEVYGDPLIHPQNEDYWGNVNPIGIRSCYDEGKRVAESLFFDFYRQFNTKIKVARIFNTYGPYMNTTDGRVVSNFLVQALSGQDITIYGSGKQSRSFCYVSDLVQGLVALMESPSEVQGPINLGNPAEFTMIELLKKIELILGKSLTFRHESLPGDDPKMRRPDISRAQKLLGWSPSVDLDSGLLETIRYFERKLGEHA